MRAIYKNESETKLFLNEKKRTLFYLDAINFFSFQIPCFIQIN